MEFQLRSSLRSRGYAARRNGDLRRLGVVFWRPPMRASDVMHVLDAAYRSLRSGRWEPVAATPVLAGAGA